MLQEIDEQPSTLYVYPDAYIIDKMVSDMAPWEREDFKDYMMINFRTQVIFI